MPTTFIHTADLQLGKPFGRIAEDGARIRLRDRRIEAIDSIGALVREREASFVLVAGDLFDSETADKRTVAQALEAFGRIDADIFVIPGNHDHGGEGSVWHQDFFKSERARHAPRLQIILERKPLIRDDAVILPAPLFGKRDLEDPTAWIRGAFMEAHDIPTDRPRIVLAHGTIQNFHAPDASQDSDRQASNHVVLAKLPISELDYIALGDWHGTMAASADGKAWYSGTPEIDRHPKASTNRPGHTLVVRASRGAAPQVDQVPTSKTKWLTHAVRLDDATIAHFNDELKSVLGDRSTDAILRLELDGSLSLGARRLLDGDLESLHARVMHLEIEDRIVLQPSESELESLVGRTSDPLIQTVAIRLHERIRRSVGGDPVASTALQRLYAMLQG
jgi:DNA repair exonuclease SbcCD nuclease subunit